MTDLQALTACEGLTSLSLAGNTTLRSTDDYMPLSSMYGLQLLSVRNTHFGCVEVLQVLSHVLCTVHHVL